MSLPAILFVAATLGPQEAPPPPETEAQQAEPMKTEEVAPAPGAADAAIEAGLSAFKRRRFQRAEEEFGKAMEADPGSAAAAFYLGYTLYKRAEPTRRLTPGKKRAAELFARAFELDPGFKPVWGRH
jgi:tetratricopeptide (TPR) repeat protein